MQGMDINVAINFFFTLPVCLVNRQFFRLDLYIIYWTQWLDMLEFQNLNLNSSLLLESDRQLEILIINRKNNQMHIN